MLKIEIKRLTIFLILLYIFLSKTNYTDADIFAERKVQNNKFSAITLDFSTKNSFNDGLIANLFSSLGIVPSGFDVRAARITQEDGANSKYYLKTIKTNGDDFFCSNLKVKVLNQNFIVLFDGLLLDLSVKSNFKDTNTSDFIYFISLDEKDQKLKNKICEFNFVFKTYRDNTNEEGGIFAQRFISNVISSGNW